MKLTAEEFMAQSPKSITLIGMSGAGKSYLSEKLAGWGWFNYSCDYLIGTKYLKEVAAEAGNISPGDIRSLSAFVGRIGNRKKGGFGLEEFRQRQKLYYKAECDALRDMGKSLESAKAAGKNFVNDSAGSLCEIEDEELINGLGKQTLFVYLKISQQDHAELLERAIREPKPLYFPPGFFDERRQAYMDKFDIGAVDNIDPDEFLRWIFPYLFEARLPKYKELAGKYGVKLPVAEIKDVSSEEEFLNSIAKALDEQRG